MQPRELSRGARDCLKLIRWYAARHTRVFPSQAKLAKSLGVSDRQVRTYLAELREAELVLVHQGGDGRTASYVLTSGADFRAEFRAGFRAEIAGVRSDLTGGEQVASQNFRAEREQLSSSSCSPGSNQSESTVQEHREPAAATEPSPFEKAQAEAIADAVRACGFGPTAELIAKLERKRRHYRVTGFVVASEIARAFKRVEGSSNEPDRLKPGWITVVVENALREATRLVGTEHRDAGETPATHRVKWSPALQAVATTRGAESNKEWAQLDQVAPIGPAPIVGAREHGLERTRATIATDRASELSIEDRRLLTEARRIFPFASRENLMEAVAEMRMVQSRTVEQSKINPRPPQHELGLREPAAASGGTG